MYNSNSLMRDLPLVLLLFACENRQSIVIHVHCTCVLLGLASIVF